MNKSATSSSVSSQNLLTTRRGDTSTCPGRTGFLFTNPKDNWERKNTTEGWRKIRPKLKLCPVIFHGNYHIWSTSPALKTCRFLVNVPRAQSTKTTWPPPQQKISVKKSRKWFQKEDLNPEECGRVKRKGTYWVDMRGSRNGERLYVYFLLKWENLRPLVWLTVSAINQSINQSIIFIYSRIEI